MTGRPLVKPIAKLSLHKFYRKKTLATHRIIELDSTHIVTQSELKTHSWRGTFADFRKQFTLIEK